MPSNKFEAVAWTNGGASFGLKISQQDRDKHLLREWGHIYLTMPGSEEKVEVNIDKPSMWDGSCRELINSKIGAWLKRERMAPWPKGHPPRVTIEPIGDRVFRITLR